MLRLHLIKGGGGDLSLLRTQWGYPFLCHNFAQLEVDFALLRAIIGVQQISLLNYTISEGKKKNNFVQFVAVHCNPCQPVLPFPSWSFAPIPIPPPSDSCNRYFPFSPILQHIISPSPLYPSSNLHQLFGILHFASIADSLKWTWLTQHKASTFTNQRRLFICFPLFSCCLFL